MTALDTALADYLGVRRAVGYQLVAAGRHLESFVTHLNRSGIDTVTVTDAVDWATTTATATRGGGAKRLSAVRGFARYLQALDASHEVPPTRLLPTHTTRPVPYLFDEADIDALMSAAAMLTPPERACTVETMIGLLWATGMRISEVIALNNADVDADQATLTVWFSKFNKSRHVPVTASTLEALARYNDAVHPTGQALFCGRDGQRIRYPHFKRVFDRLIDSVGITTNNGTRPRLHNMRHSFATRTLLGWYRDGADVHALLPRLSTYLGHVEPSSTYWYLSAAPELMALAAARLEPNEVSS
jgi:site-specific recombinase XerD